MGCSFICVYTELYTVQYGMYGCFRRDLGYAYKKIQVCSVQNRVKCTQVCMFIRQVALINDELKLNFNMYN